MASTKAYYDGPADEIYRLVWGENIHLGVPCSETCPHPEAMEHTNEIMAGIAGLDEGAKVLDLGCGYGATARYLASDHGCSVVGINVSEKELDVAKASAIEAGLQGSITFETGDFHGLKYSDESFDLVWSQEAFLHGADKDQIISEAKRVLVPGGKLIFTDLVVTSGTSLSDRERIYERIKSPVMWDADDYQRCLQSQGFEIIHTEDWAGHVARSYSWIRDQVERNRSVLLGKVDAETIDRTMDGLEFWVDSANAGKIGWSLFAALKPV